MNVKGTAAGGGNALLIPMTEFTLGLTGDIDAVTNAHNLAMVALTTRILHEANYSDEGLGKRGLRRLGIDPRRVEMKWAIDFCAQALRHVVIGLGGRKDGVPMESGFQIAVSFELMAILAVARNLGDLRRRIGEITVAYSRGEARHVRGPRGSGGDGGLDAGGPPSDRPCAPRSSTSPSWSTPGRLRTSRLGSPRSSPTASV